MWLDRSILRISWTIYVSNTEVPEKLGNEADVPKIVKKKKTLILPSSNGELDLFYIGKCWTRNLGGRMRYGLR